MTDSRPGAPRTWDPAHYLKYANHRLRPALDLLNRIPLERADAITDLGCGAGNVVPYLAQRFPGAMIEGIDRSAEMLGAARSSFEDLATWGQGDVATWQPAAPRDVIFSNAVLHWLDGHETLFPRLLGFVKPGGVLAVQMPNQFDEPSHVLMRQVAGDGPWAETLRPLLRAAPVATPGDDFDWLAGACQRLDIWETAYTQIMTGTDPVLDWLGATALNPLREALPPDQRGPFREALAAKLRGAYPMRSDGSTLFAFKRLFIVAHKSEGTA